MRVGCWCPSACVCRGRRVRRACQYYLAPHFLAQQIEPHAHLYAQRPLSACLYLPLQHPVPGKQFAGMPAPSPKKEKDAREELPIVEHTWPVSRVERYYGTSQRAGLTEDLVLEAREKYGENRLAQQQVGCRRARV